MRKCHMRVHSAIANPHRTLCPCSRRFGISRRFGHSESAIPSRPHRSILAARALSASSLAFPVPHNRRSLRPPFFPSKHPAHEPAKLANKIDRRFELSPSPDRHPGWRHQACTTHDCVHCSQPSSAYGQLDIAQLALMQSASIAARSCLWAVAVRRRGVVVTACSVTTSLDPLRSRVSLTTCISRCPQKSGVCGFFSPLLRFVVAVSISLCPRFKWRVRGAACLSSVPGIIVGGENDFGYMLLLGAG